MFSDHLRKIDALPLKTLFGIAAGLVIVCQLVAMMLVVDGQVAKAKARDARQASEQMAVLQCMESSSGVARHSCLLQVQALAGSSQPDTPLNSQAMASAARNDLPALSGSSPLEGFMPASFATR